MHLNARLLIEGRGNWAYTHSLGDAKRITIGRASDNDVALGDLHLSSRHAEILYRDGDYFIRDLNSRNGTHVNKRKIREERCPQR